MYSAATAFVYTSSYEGFGLPILEGIACGAPVIASNTSSMPEVGGPASLYFDPNDSKQLTTLIQEVTINENLLKECSRKGMERAAQFSWDNTARAILRTYHEIYSI